MESTSVKFEIIFNTLQEADNQLSVSELCNIAGVSRSGYYNWGASAAVRDTREFEKHGPRKVLLTDITYIPYNNQLCYLSTILDA